MNTCRKRVPAKRVLVLICAKRQSNLGNQPLFRTDGAPCAGGPILKWD